MVKKKPSRILILKVTTWDVIAAAVTLGVSCSRFGSLAWFSGKPVDFSRDIRPYPNQNCTSCHGGVGQKSGVSFMFREEALATGKSGRPTVVPGDPDHSELMARLTSKDPEARMPYHRAAASGESDRVNTALDQKREPLGPTHWNFLFAETSSAP